MAEIRQIRDAVLTESEQAYKENEFRSNLDFILPQGAPRTPTKEPKKSQEVLSIDHLLKGVVY